MHSFVFRLSLVIALTQSIGNTCPQTTINNATFPRTNSMTTVSGTCATGYMGNPSATCSAAGTWGSVSYPCTSACLQCLEWCYAYVARLERTHCDAQPNSAVGYASFPLTPINTVATGICMTGYGGSAKKTCTSTGVWATSAQSSCTRRSISCLLLCLLASLGLKCMGMTVGGATYPQTDSMTTAYGTCISTYEGTPIATCSATGLWNFTTTCTSAYLCIT